MLLNPTADVRVDVELPPASGDQSTTCDRDATGNHSLC